MPKLRLVGKYATGPHAYTIVDDDMVAYLSQWAWKAKPNADGNNVYAIRSTKLADGRTVDVRMHRVVLGYDGPRDIDHRNHNALDNRRRNLRVVTRSVNQLNRQVITYRISCAQCYRLFDEERKRGSVAPRFCSERCERLAHPLAPSTAVFFLSCKRCTRPFVGRRSDTEFCSRACKTAWSRPHSTRVHFLACARCGARFVGRSPKRIYCSLKCKDAARA